MENHHNHRETDSGLRVMHFQERNITMTHRTLAMIFLTATLTCSCGYVPVADDGRDLATHEDVWNFYPGFADRINAVEAVYTRGHSGLSVPVIELLALVTARYWQVETDWRSHVQPALDAGLTAEAVEAIRTRQHPEFENDPALSAAYQFAVEILNHKTVTEAAYRDVVDVFGKKGAVALAGLIGHHTMVALTVKAFRLEADLPSSLPPGSWTVSRDFSEVDHPRKPAWGYPFSPRAWPMNPHLSLAENSLGTTFPFMTDRLSELSIIITARHWNCQVPWSAHVPSAVKTGVTKETVQAIGLMEPPEPYMTDDEIALFRQAEALFTPDMAVDEATYQAAVAQVGRPGLVKLVTVMGYYSQVALVVNTVCYTLPPLADYPFPVN